MLIPSKLICSYRLQNSVVRESLLQQLEKAEHYPLVLINAPAGYGKTTLLSQWINQGGQKRVGWYSLDEGDNNPERFATYFSAALSHAANADTPLTEDAPNHQASLLTLIE